MPKRDIIVVGASAGGVETLIRLVQDLPANLPAAVFIVLHIPPGVSNLPHILSRNGPLPAFHPQDGAVIQHGQIYVAPPDRHLVVKWGQVHLSVGPHENSHRPAADVLFRSAAQAYGDRVIGVVLSGAMDDGTAGLEAIKMRGGLAVVQNPEEAFSPGMPRSALAHVVVDYCLPVSEIAALLGRLTRQEVEEQGAAGMSDELRKETDLAEVDLETIANEDKPGTLAALGCPECGGTLWEIREGTFIRFRCRVGHAWSADTLRLEQIDQLESALWTALRVLEENISLNRRMADQARDRRYERGAQAFEKQILDAQQHAQLIRQVLVSLKSDTPPTAEGDSQGA
jgi:two-component system chemotaxis response regulator CheB